jgi:FAD/FMN-containing dehydrogenase
MKKNSTDTVMAWNRLHRQRHQVIDATGDASQLVTLGRERAMLLPRGNGHSYGDTCLNPDNILLDTKGLNRVISFNTVTGVLRCQSGVTIGTAQGLGASHGWRLPVSPSTQHVSIGGAIAHDVHGRNHSAAGTFGTHVREIELIRTDATRLTCGPADNQDMFSATVGGMGLTGLITIVELQLRRSEGSFVDVRTTAFSDLPALLEELELSVKTHEHVTAWLDLTAGQFFRGVVEAGNEVEDLAQPVRAARSARRTPLRVPIDCPRWLVSRPTVRVFNKLYYRLRRNRTTAPIPVDKFLYQMDALGEWNRVLGPMGFYQYHFVLPEENVAVGLPLLLQHVRNSKNTSFLAILKKYGPSISPGLMSFPIHGTGGAFDFVNGGQRTLDLFAELDDIVLNLGGRVYLAKDSTLTPSAFRAMYPQWEGFREFVDPRFSSSLWRRLTSDT